MLFKGSIKGFLQEHFKLTRRKEILCHIKVIDVIVVVVYFYVTMMTNEFLSEFAAKTERRKKGGKRNVMFWLQPPFCDRIWLKYLTFKSKEKLKFYNIWCE